jgi:hypothetical protein
MSELLSNYSNKDQLPLYGLVYNAKTKEYEYTIGGIAVMMASRSFWEDIIELQETRRPTECTWPEAQSATRQAAAYK